MKYQCPVCFYDELPYPPADYHICLCCGTEFGNDDADFSHAQLREMWIASGAEWFFRNPPVAWNPWMQLLGAGILADIPSFQTRVIVQAHSSPLSQQIDAADRPLAVVAA
jgi:hypothetical protein